jgi:hypothetical protein
MIASVHAMLIPILIIAFSPSMSHKFRTIFCNIFYKSNNVESNHINTLQSVNGRQLMIAGKQAQSAHFENLRAAWKQ